MNNSKKYNASAFFPKTPLDKETLNILASAKIGDSGNKSTGDVASEYQNSNPQKTFNRKEQEDFLKRYGIDPKQFFD